MLIKELIDKHGKKPEKLISILLDYQKSKDAQYITEEDMKTVAAEMGLPESRVYSVASFYSLLSTEKRGKHIIQLCHDVPCYINGSFNLKEELERQLGIAMNETTGDGLFTLEHTSCLGYCEKAPAMRIDEDYYGNVAKEDLHDILSRYRSEL